MNNILASIGISQLKSIDKFIKSKKKYTKTIKFYLKNQKNIRLLKLQIMHSIIIG